eukprot:5500664-Prymnesium_polylepis.1
MRVVNDQICASMGVPASVVFEGVRPLVNPQTADVADQVCCNHRQVLVEFNESVTAPQHHRHRDGHQRQR